MARCAAKVPNRLPYVAPPTQCERQAVEGTEFCWQHDPDRIARQERKRKRGWDIQNLKRTYGFRLSDVGRAYLAGDAEALAEAVAECRRIEAELDGVQTDLEKEKA